MPIRTASLARRLHRNGQRLHLATLSRTFSHGADPAPSEQETALREERSALKAAQAERRAKAMLPRTKPVRPAAEAKPAKAAKTPKAAKPPKEKAAKEKSAKAASKPSRAEKQTKKAENVEAAKKAARKSAKT